MASVDSILYMPDATNICIDSYFSFFWVQGGWKHSLIIQLNKMLQDEIFEKKKLQEELTTLQTQLMHLTIVADKVCRMFVYFVLIPLNSGIILYCTLLITSLC